MPTSQSTSKTCKLCLTQQELRHSHILSEFLYAALYNDKHRFVGIRPVDRKQARPEKALQKGLREYMLCGQCEGRLSRFETYSATVLRSLPKTADRRPGDVLQVTGLDYQKLKLFQMSLLWRAGVARHPTFQAVELGPHEDRMRRMLLAEEPGEPWEYGCVVAGLRGPGSLDRLMKPPWKLRIAGQFAYGFIHWGLLWFYVVSSQANELPGQGSFLSKKGVFTLHVGTGTADEFLNSLKGGLRRMGTL